MWKVTIKGLLAHKLRFALTALAVTLGVAFMAGTMVLTDTVQRTFDNLFADIYRGTDAVVRGKEVFESDFATTRPPLPASLLDEARAVDGVADAQGNVQVGYAQMVDAQGDPIGNPGSGAPALGLNWQEGPLNTFTLVAGRAPTSTDEIVVDKKSADDGKLSVGQQVDVLTGEQPRSYTIVGIAKFGSADSPAGASVVLFTTPEAQRLANEPGEYDSISVVAADGVSQEEIRARLADALRADDVEVVTGKAITKESQDAVSRQLGFFNTALLVFALVALFVGSFIIYNTFSIVVAQRTRELALLRAIGAARRQVLASVLGEAIVVGLASSAAGIVVGIGLAVGLKALLAAVGVDIPAGGVVVAAKTIVVSLLAGSIITILSAVLPARKASRILPIAALREAAVERRAGFALRGTIGGVVLAAGATLLLFGLFSNVDNQIAYVGIGAAVIFVGVFVLGPIIARPAARALGTRPVGVAVIGLGGLMGLGAVVGVVTSLIGLAPVGVVGSLLLGWIAYVFARSGLASFGVTGVLARENVARSPRRSAATASALMIGVALVGFITIFAASAKASISKAIDDQLRADYVVTTGGNFGGVGVSPELAQEMAKLPELSAVSGLRFGVFQLNATKPGERSLPAGEGSTQFLTAADPAVSDQLFAFGPEEGNLSDLTPHGIGISRDVADKYGLHVGDTIPVTFAKTGRQELTVDVVYAKTEAAGDFVMSLAGYEDNYTQQLDVQIFAQLAPGVTPAQGRAAIEPLLEPYPTAELRDQAQYKADQEAQINQVVNLIYALLGLAVIIALIGIANTLALSIYERTHEIGLLRAVGMGRTQTRLTVRWEAVIISLFGTALGLVIGLFFGWAVVAALRSEGFSTFDVAPVQLVVVIVVAAVAGVLASVSPARRAAKLDVLQAISTE